MKDFTIYTKADVEAFIDYLHFELDLNFHPDDPFDSYVNIVSEQPTFTPKEAAKLQDTLDDCINYCDFHQLDIYEICTDSYKRYHGLDDDYNKIDG